MNTEGNEVKQDKDLFRWPLARSPTKKRLKVIPAMKTAKPHFGFVNLKGET